MATRMYKFVADKWIQIDIGTFKDMQKEVTRDLQNFGSPLILKLRF